MSGVSPSDRATGARAAEPGRRRGGLFSRPKPTAAPCEDQEEQVREQLYARPTGPERTVRVLERTRPPAPVEHTRPPAPVERTRPPAPVERTRPPAPVEHTRPPAPDERIAERPAA